MKFKNFLFLFCLAILFSCIENPIYFDSDLIELDEVIGKWRVLSLNEKEIDTTRVWEFSKRKEKEYLFDTGQGEHGIYLSKFLVLNRITYADMVYYPNYETHKEERDIHSVSKIELENGNLLITLLDLSYLEMSIESGKFKLPYRIEVDKSSDYNMGETMLITASTKQLQKFLKDNQNDPNLFPLKDQIVFTR